MLTPNSAQAGAIINGADPAFNVYLGSHFDQETSNDMGFWPFAASNRKEAEAMVEGLERAHGNSPCNRFIYPLTL